MGVNFEVHVEAESEEAAKELIRQVTWAQYNAHENRRGTRIPLCCGPYEEKIEGVRLDWAEVGTDPYVEDALDIEEG